MTTLGSFRVVSVAIAIFILAMSSAYAASSKGEKGDEPKQTTNAGKSGVTPGAPEAATAPLPFRLAYPDLARMLNHDATNLPIVRMPNGAEMLDLQGGFRSVMIAYTTPAGEHVVTCIESLKAAERIFTPKAPEPAREP